MENQPNKPPARYGRFESIGAVTLTAALVVVGGIATGGAIGTIEHPTPHAEVTILVNSAFGLGATAAAAYHWSAFWQQRDASRPN